MSGISFALAVGLWGVLPGLLLQYALGMGGRLAERAAAAPGLSIALVAAGAYTAELLRLPVSPLPVAAVVLGLCACAAGVRRALGRGSPPPDALASAGAFASPAPAVMVWLVLLLPVAVVAEFGPIADVLLLPPTLHDGLDHANWFRLIYELRSLDPHVLLAPPLELDGSPTYYPFGMHAVLALVAHTAASQDPPIVLMRGLMLISAALPLSTYAFVAGLTRRSWPAMAAAVGSLMFWWLPYQVWGWGGYALLSGAVAALPVSSLALAAARAAHPAGLAAALVCGAGVLTIHPSQAFAALVVAATVSVTWAAARVATWRVAVPFVAGLAVAGAGMAFGAGVWPPIGAFMDKALAVGTTLSGDVRYAWPLGLYSGAGAIVPAAVRVPLALLCALGAIAALRRRELWPFVALHLAGSALVALAPYQTWWTSLWYHAPERIWYLQYAALPALAALGVAACLAPIERLARRWAAINWTLVLWLAVAWLAFAALYRPFTAAASRQLWLYAHRNEHLTLTDRRVLPDFAWIREHVPPDAILFNAPADWGLPLPFTGRRTVFWSGGYAMDPSVNWNQLLAMLRAGEPHASQAAAELDRLDVRYVYAARLDPALEAGGRPRLSRAELSGAAGLEPLYESPTAAIFRVREASDGWLGLRDSVRITFHGFTTVQGEPGREWRWTAETGRIRIRLVGLNGRDCVVRLLGPVIDTYDVLLDDVTLPPTPRGFELPASALARDALDLRVRAGNRRSAGLAPDEPQPSGVRVTDVALRCAG
jgi:hypothetical protein